jgi:hypothetical protein
MKKPTLVKWIELPAALLLAIYVTIQQIRIAFVEKHESEDIIDAINRTHKRDRDMWTWFCMRWQTPIAVAFYMLLLILIL